MHKNLDLNFETRRQMSLLLWLALKEKYACLGFWLKQLNWYWQ